MNNKKDNDTNIFNQILRKNLFPQFLFSIFFILLLFPFLYLKILKSNELYIAIYIIIGSFTIFYFIFFVLLFDFLIKIKNVFLNFIFGVKKNNGSNNILEDTEIKNIKDDLLDRKKIVSDLVKIIEDDYKETFTISLDGEWGEGKSTIINFIKEEFKNNNDFIFFDFNPWFYSNEKSIIKGFFEELQKKYSFFSESKFLKEFITENSEKLLKFKLPFKKDRSIEELKNKISKKLVYRKQKLIIVIDDVDRLPEIKKILEVLKIIGIFQKLKNIIFLLSFSKEVVEANLAGNKIKDDKYLEKLINYNFKIITKQKNIDDYFYKKIEQEFLNKKKVIENIKKIYKDLFMPTIIDYYIDSQRTHWKFNTLREVKIFLNYFIGTYNRLHKEINIEDFFRLSIFKVFYLKIYNDILNNRGLYIHSSFLSPNQIEEKDKEYAKKHIENLVKDFKDKDFIRHNIYEMFPVMKHVFAPSSTIDHETAEKKQRIFHRDYFHRYFLEEILDDEVSDKYITYFIKNWSDYSLKRKKKLYFPDNKKYSVYLRKILLHTDKIKKGDYDIFIKENYKNLLARSSDGKNNNYYEIMHILFRLIDFIYKKSFDDKKIQEEKLNQFIDIVNNSNNLYFANYFVDYYKTRNDFHENREGNEKFIKKLNYELRNRIEKELFIDKKDIIKETNNIINFTTLIKMHFENSNQDKRIEQYLNIMFEKNLNYLIKLLELYFGNRNISDIGIKGFAELFNLKAIINFINKNINKINQLSKKDIELVNKLIKECEKLN